MPLLDHFHPPIFPSRPWESFLRLWCTAIIVQLNELLPPRYYGTVAVHLGRRVEADVAETVPTWAPPKATHTVPAIFPDDIEVQVYDSRDGAVLVAVIELVSPGNKDRPEARDAFAAKCAAYLQRGIGLLVVDVVTTRRANLHNALAAMLRWPPNVQLPEDAFLYAASYRPARREEESLIDNWLSTLAVGQPLPVVPLPIRGLGCQPLDLEAGYTVTRQDSRV